jgi:hypothetical protein
VAVLERGRRYLPGSFPRHVAGGDGLLWHDGVGIYDVRPLNDMLVVQAAGYGGGSLVYANVHMRPPPDLFEHGWPAPYSRRTLDRYYDLVAHMLDVAPVAGATTPRKTRVMVDAAARLGRTDQTFLPNLAVTFGDPEAPRRPNRFGAPQGRVHRVRRVHRGLQRRSQEHARPHLPGGGRAPRRGSGHQQRGRARRAGHRRLPRALPGSHRRRHRPAAHGGVAVGVPMPRCAQHHRAAAPVPRRAPHAAPVVAAAWRALLGQRRLPGLRAGCQHGLRARPGPDDHGRIGPRPHDRRHPGLVRSCS